MHPAGARRSAVAAAIVVAAILTWRPTRAAGEVPAGLIQYRNDALTVRLTGAPLSDVLEEICRQSGAEMRGQIREPREVTADFQSVPLPEALARLLGEQGFALVYGKGGRLKAVRLLGGSQLVADPAPPVAQQPPFPGSLPELIDHHPPVPVAGRLAEVLGAQSATLGQLLDLSLHHADADVRTEALRTGMATVEAEPELRSAVIAELNNADSALLSTLLRASASEQAEDLATQVLRVSHAPEIRLKASSVLQRLRTGG